MRPRAAFPALALLLLVALAGCQSSAPRDVEKIGKTTLSRDVLDAKLSEACDNYIRAVGIVAYDLARETDDPVWRRRLILWKHGTITAVQHALSRKLRAEGLASLYLMALQRVEYLEKQEPFFGTGEERALEVERRMAEYLDATIRDLLPVETYETVSTAIRTFAAEHPIDGMVRKYRDASDGQMERKTLLNLGSLTEPLMITEGVKETAVSISEVAQSVEQVARIVEFLPTTTMLELELLLLNVEDDPTVRGLRDSVARVGESAERMAATAEQLPTRIREEVVRGLDEIDATRADLREMVDKAATVSTEARKAVEQAATAMAEAETLMVSVRQASENLAEAGRAWGPAFESLRKITNPRGDDYVPPPPEPGPDPDIENLARTAEGIAQAGDRLHAAIVELRAVLDSGTLPGTIGDVDHAARETVDHTTERLSGLVDRITLRAAQLVGAILVAALLYRFLRRFVPGPAGS